MNTWLEGPPPDERKEMGCLGKGCLILTCFIIFLIIASAIGLYFGYKTHSAVLRSVIWAKRAHVLSQEPSPVPQFETTEENVNSAKQKWEDFKRTAKNEGAPSTRDQPARIELTADDINNLIANNRHARGKAFVTIEGNRLRIQTSVPLGDHVRGGRYYLNGDIVIQSNGPQAVENLLSGITINHEPIPADVLDWKYRSRPLQEYLGEYRTNYNEATIEIRDGRVFIETR
ncbi:MAG TPA: hypothetical protein VJR93_08810 [Chthoniobacterales bacterium]|nr:hypothetical protein [Chthoniobacterales bacterium]